MDIDNLALSPAEDNTLSNDENNIRISKDHIINNFGTDLLNVCEEMNLIIANGNIVVDDSSGNFIYIADNGSSVVAYFRFHKS